MNDVQYVKVLIDPSNPCLVEPPDFVIVFILAETAKTIHEKELHRILEAKLDDLVAL